MMCQYILRCTVRIRSLSPLHLLGVCVWWLIDLTSSLLRCFMHYIFIGHVIFVHWRCCCCRCWIVNTFLMHRIRTQLQVHDSQSWHLPDLGDVNVKTWKIGKVIVFIFKLPYLTWALTNNCMPNILWVSSVALVKCVRAGLSVCWLAICHPLSYIVVYSSQTAGSHTDLCLFSLCPSVWLTVGPFSVWIFMLFSVQLQG